MMDCQPYRTAILADPHDDSAELRLHLKTCADCARYTEQLKRFEDRLDRALRVDLPAQGRDRATVLRFRGRRPAIAKRRGWLAAAASVLLGAAVAGGLWLAAPDRSLAAAVVGHMAGEPDAWAQTHVPVPEPALEQVLSASHVRLKDNAGLVSYASSCEFRGHHVPHLVVQTAAGPVTVMVLPHESARSKERFDEKGYRGIIVPVSGHGSIAVLERDSNPEPAAVDQVAAQVLGAIDWTA